MIGVRQIVLGVVASTGLAVPALADHELLDRDVTAGAQIYAENCAACHGTNLEGEPNWRSPKDDGTLPAPPHDESGHTWHHDNELLFLYTKLGGKELLEARGITGVNSAMPGFGDALTDDQIWDVLGFIRSTWSDRVKAIQDARNPEH